MFVSLYGTVGRDVAVSTKVLSSNPDFGILFWQIIYIEKTKIRNKMSGNVHKRDSETLQRPRMTIRRS